MFPQLLRCSSVRVGCVVMSDQYCSTVVIFFEVDIYALQLDCFFPLKFCALPHI